MSEKPATSPNSPAQVEQTLGDLGRNLSASALLLQEAVAARLGLSATESKCLDIIRRAQSGEVVTPTLLVERTGLTSGAITGVLDRLESARFVRREKSPSDRRQIVVRSLPDRDEELRSVYEPYQQAFRDLLAHYQPNELLVIGRFVRETIELIERYANELSASGHGPEGAEPARLYDMSVPLAQLSAATLEVARGASGLEVRACEAASLYRIATDGPMPEVTLQRGVVRFVQKRESLFDFKRHRLGLALNPNIPWEIRVKGGLSHSSLDLEQVWLASLDILGGSSSVELLLPKPRGRVRLLLKGGVNQLSVRRAPGAPIGVVIHSGASALVLDSLQLGAVGGRTEWQSPDYANSDDRYELEVTGGANKLSVSVADGSPSRVGQ